jgi:addiction module HigA family antidote
MTRKLPPIHPGEILREEFLLPLGISAMKLAEICKVPRTRIERVASEETGVTADTAIRLGKALNTSPQLWMNLQNEYDIRTARNAAGKEIEKIKTIEKIRAA